VKRLTFLPLFFTLLFGNNGWSELHKAIYEENLSKIKLLLDKGVEIDKPSKAGITPLIMAVKMRNLKIVKLLIKHDADIEEGDKNGLTPLHYAVGERRYKIVKFLLKQPDIDLDAKNRYGITPLHQAAYMGDIELIELLLKNGADPNIKNSLGFTPCQLAYLKHNFLIAKYLESFTQGECDVSNYQWRRKRDKRGDNNSTTIKRAKD